MTIGLGNSPCKNCQRMCIPTNGRCSDCEMDYLQTLDRSNREYLKHLTSRIDDYKFKTSEAMGMLSNGLEPLDRNAMYKKLQKVLGGLMTDAENIKKQLRKGE